jgi:hypothetical protein
MLKNQNSILRRITDVREFSQFFIYAIDRRVCIRDDLNECFVLQTFYDVFVSMIDHHAQILREDFHRRCQFFFLTRRIRFKNRQREDDFCQISMHVIDFSRHALKIEDL